MQIFNWLKPIFHRSHAHRFADRAYFARTALRLYLFSAVLCLVTTGAFWWIEKNNHLKFTSDIALAAILLQVGVWAAVDMNYSERLRALYPSVNFKNRILEAVLVFTPLTSFLLTWHLSRSEKPNRVASWLFGRGRPVLYSAIGASHLLPSLMIVMNLFGPVAAPGGGIIAKLPLNPTASHVAHLSDAIYQSKQPIGGAVVARLALFESLASAENLDSSTLVLQMARVTSGPHRGPASAPAEEWTVEENLRFARAGVNILHKKKSDTRFAQNLFVSLVSPLSFTEALALRMMISSIEVPFEAKYTSFLLDWLAKIEKKNPERAREVSSLRASIAFGRPPPKSK